MPIPVIYADVTDALLTQISVDRYQKHFSIDAITFEIEGKTWILPVDNISVIIE